MTGKLKVLVVGLGNMGMSHALACTRIADFDVTGVCDRYIAKRELPEALQRVRTSSATSCVIIPPGSSSSRSPGNWELPSSSA